MFNQVVTPVGRLLASVMLAWSSLSAVAAEAVKKPVFAWPAPMRFQVEERESKSGNVAIIRHTFSFAKADDEYRLAWVAAEVLENNGKKINTPALKSEVRAAELMYVANPPMRISAAGEFLGCDLTPQVIARMNAVLDQAVPGRTKEDRQQLVNVLSSPAGQEVYVAALGQYWNCWVQQWLEAPTVPGAKSIKEVLIVVSQDHPAKGTLTFRNHGLVSANNTNVVKISAEEIVSGPDFAASVTKSVEAAAVQQGRTNDVVVTAARRQSNFEATIDLSTLRPYAASRKVRTKVEVTGEKPAEGVQEYEFRFRWPEATRR